MEPLQSARPPRSPITPTSVTRSPLTILAAFVAALTLSGCMAVGYSSGGGWFVWPGGLGLLVILLLLFFFLRGRR